MGPSARSKVSRGWLSATGHPPRSKLETSANQGAREVASPSKHLIIVAMSESTSTSSNPKDVIPGLCAISASLQDLQPDFHCRPFDSDHSQGLRPVDSGESTGRSRNRQTRSGLCLASSVLPSARAAQNHQTARMEAVQHQSVMPRVRGSRENELIIAV